MSSACVCHTDERFCFYCEMFVPLERKYEKQSSYIATFDNIRDLAEAKIDHQAMEINHKDMHIKSLQDQLDRTQKQLQASRESVYGILVESDEAKFERRIAQESLELAIKALEQINVKYMEYIENSIECDYAALKMDEIAEKALEEIKRLGEGVNK